MTDYYDVSGVPGQGSPGSSAAIRGEFTAIAAGISQKLPPLTGNGGNIVAVNAGGNALESISVAALALLIGGDFFTIDDGVNNAASSPVAVVHSTTGTPQIGIGTGFDFTTETATGNQEVGMSIESISTNVTLESEAFDMVVRLMAGGATAAERLRLTSAGKLNLVSGGLFAIDDNTVLSQTELGATVLASSLTSLGTIASLAATAANIGTLVATTADINGGTIDGAVIGGASAAAGSFSTLSFSTSLTSPGGGWDVIGIGLNAGQVIAFGGNVTLTATLLGPQVVGSSLTSVGTIATGVWQGTAIDQAYLVGQSGINTGDEVAASDSVSGVVELATQSEVNAGSDTARVVTPATLEGKPIDAASVDGKSVVVLTQAAYDGLSPDANTLYFVSG